MRQQKKWKEDANGKEDVIRAAIEKEGIMKEDRRGSK